MSKVAHDFKDKARTGDVLITESVDFGSLLLSETVLRGLKNAGFVRPSPIQLKAIPLGRCGLDLIVQAKSGTGKTCVFSVIALESILTDTASTQVLVLAPTREIAVQIWEVIRSIGSAIKDLECHTFIGGLPLQEDRMKLKKCHIAVGSPGRIKQLIEGGVLKTDSIRLFVLDEADKLLEESFQEQINWIYSALPENKQMLALSATYPEYLADHLTAYMRNPTFLRLNISDPALLGIRQYYETVAYHPMSHVVFDEKSKVLINILSSVSFEQCLVFSNLQSRAQTLADSLSSHGWPTACIAGCLDQKDRNHAMAKLKTYKCRILISTDLTSRGIDADKVNMVINLDVPKDHETYLHRIGRAGRFGAFGIAITLISDGQERLDLDSVEKKCNTQIFSLPDPLPSDLAKPDCPIFLDDVVSSEVINTRDQHSAKNSPSKQKGNNPSKSRVTDNDVGIKNVNDASDKTNEQSGDSTGHNFGKCVDVESVNEDAEGTVNGRTEKDLVGEDDRVDKHVWRNEGEDGAEEHVDNRDAVCYEGVEYNEIGDLEFSAGGETKDTGCDISENGIANSKSFECGIVVGQPQLERKFMSLNKEKELLGDDIETRDSVQFEEGEIVNDNVTACTQEELLPDSNVLKSESNGLGKIENQMVHKVQISDIPFHRNCKISSSSLRNINISNIFKNNISFKRLDKSHSYSAAKESLKVFRGKFDTDEDLTDKEIDCSIPCVDCDTIETDTLRQAVSQLQDLLENRLTICSKETTTFVEVTEEVGKEEAEKYDSISSENEIEAKLEMLNREIDSPLQGLNADAVDNQIDNKGTCAMFKDNPAFDETSNDAKDILDDKKYKNNAHKTRKQRFGYQRNFAIGHLLQQERTGKGEIKNDFNEFKHLEAAGDAPELVNKKESMLHDNLEVTIPELKGIARNSQAENSCESNVTGSATSLTMNDDQNHSSSSALRKDLSSIAVDMEMGNKYEHENYVDPESNEETDSESSVSSVTDPESTESEQDRGAKAKTFSRSRKTSDRAVNDHEMRSCKPERKRSNFASKSTDSDGSSRQSYQDQWTQWYEQYRNWQQLSMNMWGYPGTYQNHAQTGNEKADNPNYSYLAGHYPTPSMYYPYPNYQQGYPSRYYQYYTPYGQQQTNSNVQEQVKSAFQFQEEYLKQMSKHWKKEKVKK